MLRKGHILAISVIVVSVTFGLLYPDYAYGFGQLTTYHDKENGFSIKYPQNWNVDNAGVNFENYYSYVYITDLSDAEKLAMVIVSVSKNDENVKNNNVRDHFSNLYDNNMEERCDAGYCYFSELKIIEIDGKERDVVIHEFMSPEFDEIMKIEDSVDKIARMTKICAKLSDEDYKKLPIRERTKISEAMNELNGWSEDFQKAQEESN